MTEDNKKNILDYVTNTVEKTNPTSREIIKQINESDRTKWNDYLPSYWENFRYEGMVAPSEMTSNFIILYGGYLDQNNNSYGIITLVNEKFEPIKTFYEYSSGTKLRYIQYMKQEEDGTFYFIDDEVFSSSQREKVITSQKRFVMVNNFVVMNQTSNDYKINLRKSYVLPNNYTNFYCKNMYKDPNNSHYIFFGAVVDPSSSVYDYRGLKIFDLKVNVGSSNEWNMFTNENDRIFGSAIATFDNEGNVQYRCLVTNSLNASNDLICYSKTYTGNPTSNVIATFNSYKPYIDDINYKKQSVFLDYDNVYFVQNNQRWGNPGVVRPKYIGLYKYNFVNSTLTTIYEEYLGDYDYCNLAAIYIDKCNTDIYCNYINNVNTVDNKILADYYYQRLKQDIWNPIKIAEQKIFQYGSRSFFVKNNFNLLMAYIWQINPRNYDGSNWYVSQIKENYNILNYNGDPYIDYNSVLPQQAEVYSNNSLVFARNLYNKTINENQTNSTVVMPNTYLNNIDLVPQILLSQTNSQMVINNNPITKNIYETLYMNFINTINVINEDTGAIYPRTASYINQNINVGTQDNCESSSVGKVRINTNNSSTLETITWNDIDDTHKQTEFALQVNDTINSIELISNDELTTYVTIDTSELETGKTYNISQKLRID